MRSLDLDPGCQCLSDQEPGRKEEADVRASARILPRRSPQCRKNGHFVREAEILHLRSAHEDFLESVRRSNWFLLPAGQMLLSAGWYHADKGRSALDKEFDVTLEICG